MNTCIWAFFFSIAALVETWVGKVKNAADDIRISTKSLCLTDFIPVDSVPVTLWEP